ncbi:MAG TPA: glucose-1-phosphate adenylyltransferase [Nitrospiria bacterium]|jgi:glucose-1-phosphate adenylyltransferase
MEINKSKILAMVIAGGKGERLMPLTTDRTKPAVPFGGKYRIIDFVLSNFLNSELMSIYVLVQYKSQSLIEHLRRGWRISGRIQRNFITVVPPQMKKRSGWYQGTADAIYQNLNLIRDFSPELVAIFGADHIYRMDINQMIQFHLDKKADATVAALPVPIHFAKDFGIVKTNEQNKIIGFEEKPKRPPPMPEDPTKAFASMGNYIFNTDVLNQALEQDAGQSASHDFGGDIIPKLIGSNNVFAYNFFQNQIPGIQPHEEHGYWRDVGTLEAYWKANMDLLGEFPTFNLHNNAWPIMTDNFDGPAVRIERSHLDGTLIGQGSRVVDATITRSVIGRNVRIEQGTSIEDSIVLDGSIVGEKARIRRAVFDRYNVIPPGASIGYDIASDREKYYVTKSGLVVFPRGLSMGGRALNDPKK